MTVLAQLEAKLKAGLVAERKLRAKRDRIAKNIFDNPSLSKTTEIAWNDDLHNVSKALFKKTMENIETNYLLKKERAKQDGN